jgi:ribulose 1,5-bisphosphate synthetase/thiazole synthase
MFTLTEFSRRAQQVACMLMSVVIVVGTWSLGLLAAYSAAHPGYTITITQLG